MKKALLSLLSLSSISFFAQDLTQIGKADLFTLSGGINANTIFYDGTALRDPFTYILSGNLNANISGIYNIPISFSYSNQDFEYSQPFKFNRLSIHPSYKWVTAHIGDVASSFSPYTVNGHQYTGLGVDITPNKPYKISAFGGRLIRALEYDEERPDQLPAYRRMGYGIKSSYQFKKANVGLTIFGAKDDESSLNQPVPDETGITPKENLVVSLDGGITLFDKAVLGAEFATSAVTQNLNAADAEGNIGALGFAFDEKTTTNYYNAFNVRLDYAILKGTIGAGYERIDPGYNTFGAYFFNNDLENITVNATQTLFKDKLSLGVNAGLQKDNLDNKKSSQQERTVVAVNANLTASERLSLSGSYSNFQSFTNIRSQFDYINQVTAVDNLDSLNFRQLTQNANLAANYRLSKNEKKPQTINVNLSYQDTQDIQEEEFNQFETTINTNEFFNGATSYTLGFTDLALSVSAAYNATITSAAEVETLTMGPSLAVNKQFFEKKLRSSLSSSYNTSSQDEEQQSRILNFRLNAGYTWLEKHQFNLSILSLFRNTPTADNTDFTATLGYSYAFTTAKKKDATKDRAGFNRNTALSLIKVRYRDNVYEGNAQEVLDQIKPAYLQVADIAGKTQLEQIDKLANDLLLLQFEEDAILRDKVIDYLDALYAEADFNVYYNEVLAEAGRELRNDGRRLSGGITTRYLSAKTEIENTPFEGIDPEEVADKNSGDFEEYSKKYVKFRLAEKQYNAHMQMMDDLALIKNAESFVKIPELRQFRDQQEQQVRELYLANEERENLKDLLLEGMIDYFQKNN
ncbi:hypothetical protein GCM10009117_14620 [Gangjinia marincola]|uniref:Outer membrane protein beta-barrel domain-containing protein n=1 Tax=Gangjinia marincola TaxID=578463 RepID=A0ABN1MGK3_9FLAO